MFKRTYSENKYSYWYLSKAIYVCNKDDFKQRLLDELSHGFPIDFMPRTKTARPLLQESFIAKDTEITRVLLEAGADVNCLSKSGNNALMYAIQMNMPAEIILKILKNTEDIHYINETTALDMLCQSYIKYAYLQYSAKIVDYRKSLLPLIREFIGAGAELTPNDKWPDFAWSRYIAQRKACEELKKFIAFCNEEKNNVQTDMHTAYDYEL